MPLNPAWPAARLPDPPRTSVSGLHSALAAPFTGKTRVQSCDVLRVLLTVRLVWRVTWFPSPVGDFIPPALFVPFSGFRGSRVFEGFLFVITFRAWVRPCVYDSVSCVLASWRFCILFSLVDSFHACIRRRLQVYVFTLWFAVLECSTSRLICCSFRPLG